MPAPLGWFASGCGWRHYRKCGGGQNGTGNEHIDAAYFGRQVSHKSGGDRRPLRRSCQDGALILVIELFSYVAVSFFCASLFVNLVFGCPFVRCSTKFHGVINEEKIGILQDTVRYDTTSALYVTLWMHRCMGELAAALRNSFNQQILEIFISLIHIAVESSAAVVPVAFSLLQVCLFVCLWCIFLFPVSV
jgi:hypothetical protein